MAIAGLAPCKGPASGLATSSMRTLVANASANSLLVVPFGRRAQLRPPPPGARAIHGRAT
eukprot:8581441-Lingulodinium_polyedra.AAC.1